MEGVAVVNGVDDDAGEPSRGSSEKFLLSWMM
jgi:hypothetical protein